MFPFGNNSSNLEPFFRKPPSFHLYQEIQDPNSSHDDSPFFSNFPSPFFDEHELPLNQIFQTEEKTSHPTKIESSKLKEKTDDQPPRRRNLAAAPSKRTGTKDRHSKICTAQGIRDRRMRISLQVARKFFDLQDMLGYDKASKTIEWLFSKSKTAINELAKDYNISDSKSESFVSECEVMSETEENSNNIEIKEDLELSEHNQIKSPKKPRKSVFKPNIRDSREKARARARSRTEEKLMGKRIDSKEMSKSSPNCGDLEKLGFEDQERVSVYDACDYSPLVYQPSDVGTIEKLLGNSSSSASASDYPISCFMDPNWDCLLSNDRLNYAVTDSSQAPIAGNTNSIYSDTTPDFPLFHQ